MKKVYKVYKVYDELKVSDDAIRKASWTAFLYDPDIVFRRTREMVERHLGIDYNEEIRRLTEAREAERAMRLEVEIQRRLEQRRIDEDRRYQTLRKEGRMTELEREVRYREMLMADRIRAYETSVTPHIIIPVEPS